MLFHVVSKTTLQGLLYCVCRRMSRYIWNLSQTERNWLFLHTGVKQKTRRWHSFVYWRNEREYRSFSLTDTLFILSHPLDCTSFILIVFSILNFSVLCDSLPSFFILLLIFSFNHCLWKKSSVLQYFLVILQSNLSSAIVLKSFRGCSSQIRGSFVSSILCK